MKLISQNDTVNIILLRRNGVSQRRAGEIYPDSPFDLSSGALLKRGSREARRLESTTAKEGTPFIFASAYFKALESEAFAFAMNTGDAFFPIGASASLHGRDGIFPIIQRWSTDNLSTCLGDVSRLFLYRIRK